MQAQTCFLYPVDFVKRASKPQLPQRHYQSVRVIKRSVVGPRRTPQPILDALKAVVERGHLGYPMIPDAYYDAIRDWLLRRTSWNIDARCCVAQNEGVYAAARYALQIFAKPGDKAVILTPVHFCFKEIINLNGRKGIECPLVLTDNSYEINFSGLEACLASGAKVLWLCNPHAPVGRGWTKAELSRIADLCLKYQAYIILDDVYSGLIFPSKEYTPIASLSKEISYRTITLYSSSKSYNTAGLRHAFIVAENPAIHKRYTELLTSANQHYGQNIMGLAATIAAFNECDSWLSALMKKMADNHRFLSEFFAEHMPSCKVINAEATYFAWIDLGALKIPPQRLSYFIQEETHVVVENGYAQGKGGAGFLRFNLAASDEHLHEAAQRFKVFCKR